MEAHGGNTQTARTGKTVLAVSGKGGTGKTTVSAGVAACLAALGHPVVLVDCDIGLRNIDIVLGVTDKAVLDFGDVTDGSAELEDALIEHPAVGGLHILPAPSRARPVDAVAFAEMIAGLTEKFDFVWMDGPAGCGEWISRLSGLADSILVVTTPDASSLRDAARLSALLEAPGGRGRLIVNRVRPRLIRRSGVMLIDDIMDETGLGLLGLVPEDERVIAAGNKGVPLACTGQDGAALSYRNIALRMLGRRVPLEDIKVTERVRADFWRRLK